MKKIIFPLIITGFFMYFANSSKELIAALLEGLAIIAVILCYNFFAKGQA